MKLREFLWWPREWSKDDMWSSENTVPSQQFRQNGFLAGCKLTRHGLLMEVDITAKRSSVELLSAALIRPPTWQVFVISF